MLTTVDSLLVLLPTLLGHIMSPGRTLSLFLLQVQLLYVRGLVSEGTGFCYVPVPGPIFFPAALPAGAGICATELPRDRLQAKSKRGRSNSSADFRRPCRVSIALELVENADRPSGPILDPLYQKEWFHNIPRGFVCTVKFERPCSRAQPRFNPFLFTIHFFFFWSTHEAILYSKNLPKLLTRPDRVMLSHFITCSIFM